jgi:hypothetical protein
LGSTTLSRSRRRREEGEEERLERKVASHARGGGEVTERRVVSHTRHQKGSPDFCFVNEVCFLAVMAFTNHACGCLGAIPLPLSLLARYASSAATAGCAGTQQSLDSTERLVACFELVRERRPEVGLLQCVSEGIASI